MSDRKAVIKNADMSEEMQQDAVDCATQALEKYNIEKVYILLILYDIINVLDNFVSIIQTHSQNVQNMIKVYIYIEVGIFSSLSIMSYHVDIFTFFSIMSYPMTMIIQIIFYGHQTIIEYP